MASDSRLGFSNTCGSQHLVTSTPLSRTAQAKPVKSAPAGRAQASAPGAQLGSAAPSGCRRPLSACRPGHDNPLPPSDKDLELSRRNPPPSHFRDHFPPGRGQDHADRKTAAVLGCDPDRRLGEGAQGQPPRHLGLDGNRKAARDFGGLVGDADAVPRSCDQPARHPRPQRLLGRHLPGADCCRFGLDGDRCRQRRGIADPPIDRGLPATRHPHPHLRQQDGPRSAGAPGHS